MQKFLTNSLVLIIASVVIIFYPILSFWWFSRMAIQKKRREAWGFALVCFLGIVGYISLAYMFIVSFPWDEVLALVSCVIFILGYTQFSKLTAIEFKNSNGMFFGNLEKKIKEGE